MASNNDKMRLIDMMEQNETVDNRKDKKCDILEPG